MKTVTYIRSGFFYPVDASHMHKTASTRQYYQEFAVTIGLHTWSRPLQDEARMIRAKRRQLLCQPLPFPMRFH